jgi:hypothetical protein
LQQIYTELDGESSFFQPPGGPILSFPCDGHKKVSMYCSRTATGPLAKAPVDSAPGKNMMGYGSQISFDDHCSDLERRAQRAGCVVHKRSTAEFMDWIMPNGMGVYSGEMMECISNSSYFGPLAARLLLRYYGGFAWEM